MRGKQAAERSPVEKAEVLPEMVIAQGAPGDDLGEAGTHRVARPGMREQKAAQKLFLHIRLAVGHLFQSEGADSDSGEIAGQDIVQLGTRKAGCLRRRRLAGLDLLERS